MLYFMIIKRLHPENKYNIYLDIKDTNSSKKVYTLKKFLNQSRFDYNAKNTINNIQTIRSYESNLMQLTDILLGAIVYFNNRKYCSQAKNSLVKYIQDKSKKSLSRPTLLQEPKFNIFITDALKMKLRGENDL